MLVAICTNFLINGGELMSNIVITGGNQGIGFYMAEEFLSKGDNVAVLDLKNDNLSELQKQYNDQLRSYICDVTDFEKIQKSITDFIEDFKVIDIAIHNACICTFQSMENTSIDTYKMVYDVNYLGAVRLTKAVIPFMKSQCHGRIIYTSSGVGVTGFMNVSPYSSSKGALESLAKCMNIEYANKGISFHLFHPPLTKTASSDPLPIPPQMKADPKIVGRGLAKNAKSKSFIICNSFLQKLQMNLCYLFPNQIGKLMSRMASSF